MKMSSSVCLKCAIAIATIIVFSSCQQVFNSANEFMNSFGFEKLVERFEGAERDAYQKPAKVLEYIGNVQGETIMDIGAGTGYFTFRLANVGAKVIAADVDDRFLNYIKKKKDSLNFTDKQIELRKVEYDSPLLNEEEVDKVIIVNTYHHIEDRVEYCKKVIKGIKAGGKLIIIDFFKKDLPFGPPPRHKVSIEEVKQELQAAGFSEFEIEKDLLEYQYIVTGYK